MQTDFYNRLLDTCERRGHSLTARFEACNFCNEKTDEYGQFPDLAHACEEVWFEMYMRAMATPPRDADEALLLFDKWTDNVKDLIDGGFEDTPYLQAAVDNLRAFLESTAKLHAEARKVFFGGVEDATNNKAKPLNTEEELDAVIKFLDGSIKQAVKKALPEKDAAKKERRKQPKPD